MNFLVRSYLIESIAAGEILYLVLPFLKYVVKQRNDTIILIHGYQESEYTTLR